MVRVIVLSNPRAAQAFIDYMATQGVSLRAQYVQKETEIWLDNEQQLPQVQAALQQFIQQPHHPRYQEASWKAGKLHQGLSASEDKGDYLQRLRSHTGPLTLGVMILCILVFVLQQVWGNGAVMAWLAWPEGMQQGMQLWRWFSPAVLHFSFQHLLFSLLYWWYLAGKVEKHAGTSKLFVLTLVAALFSGWAQSIFSGANFGGLSGVVYALIGYIWLSGERRPERGLSLPRGLVAFLLIWMIAGYLGFLGPAKANAAHFGGLVLGLMMAFSDTRNTTKTGPRGQR